MPSFSQTARSRLLLVTLRVVFWAAVLHSNVTSVYAEEAASPVSAASPAPAARSKTLEPEEEDLKGTPYTQYGEFNEQDEEEAVTRYLQYGRFFGVSFGGGLTGVTGVRGTLYQGGLPSFELKLHYWFDFDLAMEMAVNFSSHYFDTVTRGRVDTTLLRLGLDLK
jgi:hypothetical protein